MMRPLILILILLSSMAQARPADYQLDDARSKVQFTYELGSVKMHGNMPVASANMQIDLDNLPASSVEVTLDATRVKAGFLFATQAVKSPPALHTAKYPEIYFRSTQITGDLTGAVITGNLTVRGVTRLITLKAGFYRQQDTDIEDRDNLSMLLTGNISRSAFGADGYQAYVGDMVHLRILALVSK